MSLFSQLQFHAPEGAPLALDPLGHENRVEKRDQRICRLVGLDKAHLYQRVVSEDEMQFEAFLNLAPFMASEHRDVICFRLEDESRVSCINWHGRHFITGTDIVRVMLHRYQHYTGKPPVFAKKFEEGIFSDLRRLTAPNDCALEGTRSEFLEFLFTHDCVRSKKKQKVFFWSKFCNHVHSFFCDAFEREVARMEMAKAVNMTVEEFIKSGLVPTGVTATLGADHAFGAGSPTDWTRWAEYERFGTVDGAVPASPPLKPNISMDQVHVIRNDISSCFGRLLRSPMRKRGNRTTPEMLEAAEKAMRLRSEKGKPIAANFGTGLVRRPSAPSSLHSDSEHAASSSDAARSPASPRSAARRQKPKTSASASASPLARIVVKPPKQSKPKRMARPLSDMYIGERPRLPLGEQYQSDEWSSDDETRSAKGMDPVDDELASAILSLKSDKRGSIDDTASDSSKRIRLDRVPAVDRTLASSPDLHTDSSAGPSPAVLVLNEPPSAAEANGAVFAENKGAKTFEAACILLGLSNQ